MVVALPQAQLRIGQVKGIVSAPLPSLPRTMGWSAGLLLFVALLAGSLSEANLLLVGTAATFAIVMLSLVLLTGYGGHVSLAQLTFAGVGALTYAKLDEPNLYGLLVSVLVAAAVGALVALPVLRLTGLYLALATLAFASIMDKMRVPGRLRLRLQRRCSRPSGSRCSATSVSSTGGYVFVMAVFLVLIAWAVLLLRRGRRRPDADRHARQPGRLRHPRPGRALVPGRPVRALGRHRRARPARSSPGCGRTSAPATSSTSTACCCCCSPWSSGVTSVTGAVLGGIALMLLPELQASYPSVAGMFFVVDRGRRDPAGQGARTALSGYLFRLGRWLERRIAPSIRANLPTLPGGGETSPSADERRRAPSLRRAEGVPAHAH